MLLDGTKDRHWSSDSWFDEVNRPAHGNGEKTGSEVFSEKLHAADGTFAFSPVIHYLLAFWMCVVWNGCCAQESAV